MESADPEPIVATPAANLPELRGRRVLIGIPGVGFRPDLRADDWVVRGGRTYVPVLTEQDYYRAEVEQIEVFAPLVPLERVWVEEVTAVGPHAPAALDAPAVRWPTPAAMATSITGRRVIHRVADGYLRDLRALSDVYVDAAGSERVRVCGESEWYAWALSGSVPSTMDLIATTVWVE